MAIYRLFKDQAFEPEAISAMSRTYTDVCRVLGLNDGDLTDGDGITAPDTHVLDKTVVAKTVIEFAQRGARDHRQLSKCVLEALKQ